MNTIKRIQNIDFEINELHDLNIYENYSNKIKKRFSEYDYSKFEKSNELYNYFIEKLSDYENNNKGKCVIIHGDFVMTNIIINTFGKIKLIDMRGKIGNKLTIYGDYLYDWAKLYQSLIGYDKILMNKYISDKYEKYMIDIFENYFIQLYSSDSLENLKIITKSLLFSLIPLHDNELCLKYYNLCFNF
jgi:hypothetical protein